MGLDSSLSWLALTLTPGIAARLSARLLKEFGSPDEVFRAPLRRLEGCNIPAPSAQAIVKKQSFKRAEKDLANLRKVSAARVINWTEPEYPKTFSKIYGPAGNAIRTRQHGNLERAEPQHCRHAQTDTLRVANGRASGPRSCHTGDRYYQWSCARHRLHRPSGSACCRRPRHRCARHRNRCLLPEGKQEALRKSSGERCHS